ncbi:PTS sugar transporter subunit IIA [bacterium 1XD21-13]|nr:PTS sugar transporter subunit IIA [bacterium 1XD21-13]
MVGLLIVTHGSFSREIVSSAELIVGKQKSVEALTLTAGEDVNELRTKVEQKIQEMNLGEGVLILVDLLGGSPWNVASVCIRAEDVECVAGLNMPMLLEALEGRNTYSLQELKTVCMSAATEGVVSARELFVGCCEEEGD